MLSFWAGTCNVVHTINFHAKKPDIHHFKHQKFLGLIWPFAVLTWGGGEEAHPLLAASNPMEMN